jgi:hypothetical protein
MFLEGPLKRMKPIKLNLKEDVRMYLRDKTLKFILTTFSGTRKLKEKLKFKLNKTLNLNFDLPFVRNSVNMTEQDDYITETPEDPYNHTKAVTSSQPRQHKTNSYTGNKKVRASLANESAIKYKPKYGRNIRKKTQERSSSTTPP